MFSMGTARRDAYQGAVATDINDLPEPLACAGRLHGAFALLNRPCDLLRRNSGRIVMAATAHINVRHTARKQQLSAFDPTRFSRAFDPAALYVQSLMAIRPYAKEFARRLAVRGVAANAVDAGLAD
jgi:NAD(P)-dependent dehydrogenase (short-subunit alcohol dehydrogenase family)